MNHPLRRKGIRSARSFATGALCASSLFALCAAPARADIDTTEFCHTAFGQAAAAKRAVEGMTIALNDAARRVGETAPEDRDATIQRAQTGVHELRAVAARQLQTSAETIEENEPSGLSDDWQALADQLVTSQRDLADTILYKDYPSLKPSIDNLNQTSVSFFSLCDAQSPDYPHASSAE